MRLRRDHGPRAGMVNSVSSSIRQADPLATRSPPSHSLSSPLKRLCTSPSSIYLSPSFHLSFCLSFPSSLSLVPRLRFATLRKIAQILELPNGTHICLKHTLTCWLLIYFFQSADVCVCARAYTTIFLSFVRSNEVCKIVASRESILFEITKIEYISSYEKENPCC